MTILYRHAWCMLQEEFWKKLTSLLYIIVARLKILTAVLLKIQVFCDVTLCRLLNSYLCLEGQHPSLLNVGNLPVEKM